MSALLGMVVAWWAEWLQSELRDTRAPLGGLPLQAVIVPAGYHGSARGPPGPRWHLALALGGAPWYAPQGTQQVAFNLDDLANAPAPNSIAFGHDQCLGSPRFSRSYPFKNCRKPFRERSELESFVFCW